MTGSVKSPAALRLVSAPPLTEPPDSAELPTEDLSARPDLEVEGPSATTTDLGIPRPSSPGAAPVILESQDITPPGDQRRARRHVLRGNAIRVGFAGASELERGRVRDISIDGGLFVELIPGPAMLTGVRATPGRPSGHEMCFEGKVVRKTGVGVAVRLRVDQPSQAFLNVFVAVARGGDRRRPLEIRLDPMDLEPAADAEVHLSRTFQEALLSGSDDAHQRFIQACLSEKRLDYALSRYRAEKTRRGPEELSLDPYLAQVGTILGFTSMTSADKAAEKPAGRGKQFALVALVALVALGGLFVLLARYR